jgi:starch synthase
LPDQSTLNICLASSELAPLAKTGGLADVSAALGAYLHRKGHDVRVLIPRYSRIDESALDIEPVAGLGDMTIEAGSRTIHYSIDRTTLPGSGLPVYLLNCPGFFGRDAIYTQDADEYLRFVLLSRAMLEMCQRMQFSPDIVHCNDWQTALLPLYLKTTYAWDSLFATARSVLTIHNIGYQGMFPSAVLGDLGLDGVEQHLHQDDLRDGVINFLKTGVLYADAITTVSPTYAREIMGEDYGMGLNYLLRERMSSVVGILNGVDYGEWSPETDPLIPANYSADDLTGKATCKKVLLAELGLDGNADRPLVGLVSRLVDQKGIDLIEEVMPWLLGERDVSFVALGSGEHRYEDFLARLQQAFPGRVCFYSGFSNRLAHWIEAGSDMFLMPSRYEPCGLNQMYSLRYGTVPIVRETGGLADSVEQADPRTGSGTGVLFRDYDAGGLAWAMHHSLELFANRKLWRKIMLNGMAKDFSWDRQGALYVNLFNRLLGRS